MGVQDLERIESKIDLTAAGATAVSDAVGGVLFQNMSEVMQFAKLMAVSQNAVPPHLRANPGACLAVCVQALEWRMSPFAVANQSYEVNNRISYQAMLVHAVIEARAPLKGRLRPEYEGEGETRVCIIRGHLKGEVDPLEYRSPRKGDLKVQNSPLWKSDPDQQLFYYATRAWCRRYCPDVLLGIYAEDEMRDAESMKDITPSKPDVGERLKGGKGRRGFSHEGVTQALEHKPEQALNTVPARADPQPASVTVETRTTEPEQKQPAQEAVETPLARGQRLLPKCKDKAAVADLRSTILDELQGDDLAQWNAACDARAVEVKG